MDSKHRAFLVGACAWAVLAPWIFDVTPLQTRLLYAGADPQTAETWATLVICAAVPLAAYVAAFIAAPAALRWIAAGDSSR